jgi:hypothetical protein
MTRYLALLALLPAPLLAAAPATQPTSATTRPIAQSAADGSVLLHARDVTVHGKTVRYEPKPEKNTIGYWTVKQDWVSWDFTIAHGGTFHVLALQGCGKGSGGSEVEFTVTSAAKPEVPQTIRMTVQDTGGFQKFIERDLGQFNLVAGRYTLAVKPITKPGLAVMDLRQVVLKPAEK